MKVRHSSQSPVMTDSEALDALLQQRRVNSRLFLFMPWEGLKIAKKKNFPEKFFRVGTLSEKDPHPLKKKVFLNNLEDSFLDIWKIGEIIWENWRGFYLRNSLWILWRMDWYCWGDFFGIFFGLEGFWNFGQKIWPEIRARNSPPPFGCGRAGVMEGGLT